MLIAPRKIHRWRRGLIRTYTACHQVTSHIFEQTNINIRPMTLGRDSLAFWSPWEDKAVSVSEHLSEGRTRELSFACWRHAIQSVILTAIVSEQSRTVSLATAVMIWSARCFPQEYAFLNWRRTWGWSSQSRWLWGLWGVGNERLRLSVHLASGGGGGEGGFEFVVVLGRGGGGGG